MLTSNYTICRLCYSSRHSQQYQKLHLFARAGEVGAERFGRIRHLIGRLNHTMKAVKSVVEAGLFLRELFDTFEVSRVTSSQDSPNPLKGYNPTLDQVTWGMLDDHTNMPSYRKLIKKYDTKFNLKEALKRGKEKNRGALKHWIHAELLVLDHFWVRNLEFVGGDRFIACSKPACYCFYHYIKNHPGGFVSPASHSNCYFSWAPPIHDPRRLDLVEARDGVLSALRTVMCADALKQIRGQHPNNKDKPDSSTEISSPQNS